MAKLKLRPAEVGPTGRAVACSKMRSLAPFGGRKRGQHEAATGATIGHALFVLIEEPIMLRLRGPLEKHAGRGLVRKQLSNGLASSRRRSTSGEKRHGDRRRRAREGLSHRLLPCSDGRPWPAPRARVWARGPAAMCDGAQRTSDLPHHDRCIVEGAPSCALTGLASLWSSYGARPTRQRSDL